MTQAMHRREIPSRHLLRLSLIAASALMAFLLFGIRSAGTNSPAGTVLLPRGADRTIDLSSFLGQS